MRTRLGLAAAALSLLFAGTAEGGVQPGITPFGGSTSTALRINAHTSYLVEFTVLREVTPRTSSLELISHVQRCDTSSLSCAEVTEQTDLLPLHALTVAPSGRSATLRATWGGIPLAIAWVASGAPVIADGYATVVISDDGRHHQLWAGHAATLHARASTRLFGHTCHDGGLMYSSQAGAAEDYMVSGPSNLPRAESIRAALARTKGQCFNPQNG